jgi:hypothetical protein
LASFCQLVTVVNQVKLREIKVAENGLNAFVMRFSYLSERHEFLFFQLHFRHCSSAVKVVLNLDLFDLATGTPVKRKNSRNWSRNCDW